MKHQENSFNGFAIDAPQSANDDNYFATSIWANVPIAFLWGCLLFLAFVATLNYLLS